MTPEERDAVLDAIDEAVIKCPTLNHLKLSLRLEAARLIRRAVEPRIQNSVANSEPWQFVPPGLETK